MNLLLGKLIVPTALCLLLAACAQTGPPLPPSLELPKAPSDLRASRKGNQVTLSWTEPARTTDRQSIRYLGPTRVCRGTEHDMTECANPVMAVPPLPRSKTPSGSPAASLQTYTDTLPEDLQQQNTTGDVTYAVEVQNRDGRSAGLSNRAPVPAVPTLPPPPDLTTELTDEGVALTWISAGQPANQSGIQHRYRIYRRNENTGKEALAGEMPAGDGGPIHFLDSSFEWEKTYLYRVTAVSIVSRPPSGEVQVEGDDSPTIRVVAHDVFPPAVPAGLQAVYSGEGQKPFVDLIWAQVTNADLGGYNVYRREADRAVTKINSELVKSPSYRDTAVVPGRTYIYSVSAVDVRDNQSARSEEASETVP
jgi:hypothetical protein